MRGYMRHLNIRFTAALFLLILAPIASNYVSGNDSEYEHTRRSYADEHWRNTHQWKGRNEGGWQHGHWYGGVQRYTHPGIDDWGYAWYSDEMKADYFGEGYDEYGNQRYYPYYYPYYFYVDPNGNPIYFGE